MNPYYKGFDENFKLSKDDIDGIQYLYGKKPELKPDVTTTKPTLASTISTNTTRVLLNNTRAAPSSSSTRTSTTTTTTRTTTTTTTTTTKITTTLGPKKSNDTKVTTTTASTTTSYSLNESYKPCSLEKQSVFMGNLKYINFLNTNRSVDPKDNF